MLSFAADGSKLTAVISQSKVSIAARHIVFVQSCQLTAAVLVCLLLCILAYCLLTSRFSCVWCLPSIECHMLIAIAGACLGLTKQWYDPHRLCNFGQLSDI